MGNIKKIDKLKICIFVFLFSAHTDKLGVLNKTEGVKNQILGFSC